MSNLSQDLAMDLADDLAVDLVSGGDGDSTWRDEVPGQIFGVRGGIGETVDSGNLQDWQSYIDDSDILVAPSSEQRPTPNGIGWAGLASNATVLDGATDLAATLNNQPFTMALRFSHDNGNSASPFCMSHTPTNTHNVLLQVHSSGDYRFTFRNDSGTTTINGGSHVPNGQTLDLIGTFDGTWASLYLNGNLIAGPMEVDNIPGDLDIISLFALRRLSGPYAQHIDGTVYEAMIWGRPLESQEAFFVHSHWEVDFPREDSEATSNIVPPSTSGTPTVGSIISVDDGTWDMDLDSVTYQWQRYDGDTFVSISGETESSLSVAADHIGSLLRCAVTGEANGQFTTAFSNEIAWAPVSGVLTGSTHHLDNVACYIDPENVGNIEVSGAFDQLTDLGPRGNDHSSPSASERPAVLQDPILHGRKVAEFDGVDDSLQVAVANLGATFGPFSEYLLFRYLTFSPGAVHVGYFDNQNNRPNIGAGSTTGTLRMRAASTTFTQTSEGNMDSADVYRSGIWHWDGALDTYVSYTEPTVYPEDVSAAGTNSDSDTPKSDGGLLTLGSGIASSGTVGFSHIKVASSLLTTDVLTAAEQNTLLAFWRNNVIYTAQWDEVPFVGTLTDESYGQPGPYPPEHEGRGGNTVAASELLIVGNWVGGDTTLGSLSDPGTGNRGTLEDLVVDRGETGMILVVMLGMNDASSGPIDTDRYLNYMRRLWAVGDGSVDHLILCEVTGRDDANQVNVDTFNAALPGIVSTLNGESVPCSLATTASDWNVATDNADPLHPNRKGAQMVASEIYDALVAQGFDADMQAGTRSVVPIGDSVTAGGPNHVVGQYRSYLAKLLWESWNP